MCKFFSLCSQGDGKPLYFNAEIRQKILDKTLNYELDSHTSIADYYGHKAEKEDLLNKYEYNVWTKYLEIDHLGAKDDSKQIKDFCDKLDFKTVVPNLIIKPVINPLKDIQTLKITKADIKLLKEWDSVGASVWASVWASVGASVWDSVGDSVWASVRDSVRDSVGASVWASVGASVWDSVCNSVRASVWAYIATFVKAEYKYNLKPAQKLWERGLVASFDGTSWRLHGKDGRELYKITQEELKK